MRYRVAMTLVLMSLVAACTGTTTQGAPSSTRSPTPSASPSPVSGSDIRFVLDNSYPVGHRVAVRIENVGDVTYNYQGMYQACFLSYTDAHGRTFIIPPGTHCDMLVKVPIEPGETKKLFTWDLDECVKDQWGCVKSQPLDPGTYTIRGRFQPVGDGSPAHAETTFEIQPSTQG